MSCVLHLRLSCKSLTYSYVNVLCTTPSPILPRRFDLLKCQCLVHYTFAYPAKVWLKDMSMSCVLHLRLSCKSLTYSYVNVLCTTPSPILQRRFDLLKCQWLVHYTFAYPGAKVWLKDMSMSCVLHLRLSCKSLTYSYVNVLCTTPSPILQRRFDLLKCQCLVHYTFAYPAKVWLKDMSMSCVLHLRLSCKSLTYSYVNVLCTTPSPILQRRFDLLTCQCLVHYTFAYPAKVWLKDMSMSCVLHLRLSCKSLTYSYVNVLCTTPSPILQKFDLKLCQCLVYYTFAYPAKEVWFTKMSMACALHLRLSCKSLT